MYIFYGVYKQVFCKTKYCKEQNGYSEKFCNAVKKNAENSNMLSSKIIKWYLYCLDIFKNYQRETQLFELSRDTNSNKLKIRKNMSLCNGFILPGHSVTQK